MPLKMVRVGPRNYRQERYESSGPCRHLSDDGRSCRRFAEACHPTERQKGRRCCDDCLDYSPPGPDVTADRTAECVHLGRFLHALPCGCRSNVELTVHACAVYGEAATNGKSLRVHSCIGCPRKTTPPLVVNHGAAGLGDALLGSWAINALRLLNPDRQVIYKVHALAIPFVRLWDLGHVQLAVHDWDLGDGDSVVPKPADPRDVQMNPGYGNELKTRGRRSRLERWSRNVGGVVPRRPELRDREALVAAGRRWRGAVVLAPFSTWSSREWPVGHWLRLERLLREEGYRVVVCDGNAGKRQGRTGQFTSEKLVDGGAEEVCGLVLNACCVVSNDSGMAHLGAMLGARTLVLCGQTSGPEIYGVYGPNAAWLDGHMPCKGCWWNPPEYSSARCEPKCPNLMGISPEEALAKIKAHARRLREPLPFGVKLHLEAVEGVEVQGRPVDRAPTMRAFLERALLHPRPHVVETGCQREVAAPGDGMSTSLLAVALADSGGRLTSVDSSPESCAVARSLGLEVEVVQADSADWLRGYAGPPLQGVYLDSQDYDPSAGDAPQLHCLHEAMAAARLLEPTAPLLIDDTWREGGGWRGKGELAVPHLLNAGWTLLADGYQALLVRDPAEPPAPPQVGETCKAHARRRDEGWYARYVRDPCLDVGCNDDFFMPGFPCRRWDQRYGDGDATLLAGIAPGSYATVYASHVLEHLDDPVAALRRWHEVLRPGGHLIACVPHRDLYERKADLPSRWNVDHRTYWLPEEPGPGDPPHVRGLRRAVLEAIPDADVVSLRVLDAGYRDPGELRHAEGEFSIEVVVRKR